MVAMIACCWSAEEESSAELQNGRSEGFVVFCGKVRSVTRSLARETVDCRLRAVEHVLQNTNTMAIFLYAEHLLNIRAISVQAVLPSPSNKNTRATLSADGTRVTLSHEGNTETIQLPTHVRGDQIATALTIPSAPTDTLSFRVQLQESSVVHASQEVENILPWNAHSLATSTQLSCTHCRQILLHRGTVLVWKDLPSENWAEMMDFWHCHRPDLPHDHDHRTVAKGYSADSTLAINPGVGMVDPVDFVLAHEDCCNLKVGHAQLSVPPRTYSYTAHQEPALSGCKAIIMRASGYNCATSSRRCCEAGTSLQGRSGVALQSYVSRFTVTSRSLSI